MSKKLRYALDPSFYPNILYMYSRGIVTISKRFYKTFNDRGISSLADKIISAENEFREAFPDISDSDPLILVNGHSNHKKNRVTRDEIENFFSESPLPEEVAENAKLSELHAKNQTY